MKGHQTETNTSSEWLALTLISLLLCGAVASPMIEEIASSQANSQTNIRTYNFR